MSACAPPIIVVGAGLAGMTAALRLAERGYAVRLLEHDAFPGGQYGGHRNPDTGLFHEHSLHLFLNWYQNFWDIANEIGVRERFVPRTTLKFLRRGEFPRTTELNNVGAIDTWARNLASGVIPAPDMWLYGYSLLDLISEPLDRRRFLDSVSVNGFMHSRLYATEHAAEQHNRTLAKAFASYSYATSASTYRSYIANSFRRPSPMMWVLEGNSYDNFIAPLVRRLEALGVRIETLSALRRLILDDTGRVQALDVARVDRSPSEYPPEQVRELGRETLLVDGDLILAMPVRGLVPLLDESVLAKAPELARVEKLTTAPMLSLDLHFRRRLADIPREHTVLMDSPYDITFIDNSQLWPGLEHTVLNVVAAQTYGFTKLSRTRAIDLLIEELRSYLPFEREDVDDARTFLQTNVGDQLMVHDVGSWDFRPTTETALNNVFLAGDYCRNFVDVVSVESAVVSGLLAAEAVRSRRGIGAPVAIRRPPRYPRALLQAIKWGLAPYAGAAKVMSTMLEHSARTRRPVARRPSRD